MAPAAGGFSTTLFSLSDQLKADHWAKVWVDVLRLSWSSAPGDLILTSHCHTKLLQVKRYPGAVSDIDMRAEVGLVSSNIIITAIDGPTTYVRGTGELFGARLVVAGNSTARISHVSGGTECL